MQEVATEPLQHERLRAAIVERIAGGAWAPGARILSERELCARFAVSRTTTRRVIGDLVHQGLLRSLPGKGTFVAVPQMRQELRALTGFTEDMRRRGLDPVTRVIGFALRPAAPREAVALQLAPEDRVMVLRRLRLTGEKPLAVQEAVLPEALCPGLDAFDFARISLYRVLRENYGRKLSHGTTCLSAGLARDEELAALRLQRPAAVLRSVQTTWLDDGRAIEYCRSSFTSDDFELTTSA
jgi:GntR family transcriptional regulator